MLKRLTALIVVALVGLVVPTVAGAQSVIAGQVKDASGGILPGVTVEASSPALIEKVRVVTTDVDGLFRISDLRPGTYDVAFSLPGFSSVVRQGIILPANFTASINAELPVGALSERITVTGDSPIVDVQTSQRQEVVSQALLESVPTGRSFVLMAGTVPSVTTGAFDVGGSSLMWSGGSLQVHGSVNGDSRTLIDGMAVDGMAGTGQCSCIYDNEMQTQEIAVQVSGGSAENQLSGVIVNRIPKSGGNVFASDLVTLFSNDGFQSDNITPALRQRGIRVGDQLHQFYDLNYSVGGPIVRDRLWFFGSGRNWAYNNYIANAVNKDGSRALDDNALKQFPVRLTAQLTRRDRLTSLFDWGNKVKGHFGLAPNVAPEATNRQNSPAAHILQLKWTSTLSNRLLLEAGYSHTRSGGVISYRPDVAVGTCHVAYDQCPAGTSYGDIPHVDTLLGTTTVASPSLPGSSLGPAFRPSLSQVMQASLSYVTGAHSFKVGYQHRRGWSDERRSDINADLNQLYRNGVPFAVQVLNTPNLSRVEVSQDIGVFVQDNWTMQRLTVSPGLRWDHFNSSIPAQTVAAGRFVPARQFAAIDDVPNWNNLSPRLGASYDLTGRGRTAVKGNFGVFVQSQGPGFAATYNPMVFAVDQRTWDDLNRDDIAQENELGPPSNLSFGLRRNRNSDPNIARPYQTVWDVSIQHEVVKRVGVSASYNQRNFYKLTWTDNLALGTADYSLVTVDDPRGGEPLPVYNIARDKFGLVDELDTDSSENMRYYRGFDLSLNIRLDNGGAIFGGTSTGHLIGRECQVEDLNSQRFCDQTQYDIPMATLFKLTGSYPLPYGLRASGTFQSLPGTERVITYQVTRSLIPTLSQASVNVRLNEPGSEFNDRVNQLDLSLARDFRHGHMSIRPELAAFNLFNVSPVITQLNTYGPTLGNATRILAPRLLRFGLSMKF